MNFKNLIKSFFFFAIVIANAQEKAIISGTVTSANEPVPFAFVYVKDGFEGTTANEKGAYELEVPVGEVNIEVSSQGYRKASKTITLKSNQKITLDFELYEDLLGLDEVVISATRNRVNREAYNAAKIGCSLPNSTN